MAEKNQRLSRGRCMSSRPRRAWMARWTDWRVRKQVARNAATGVANAIAAAPLAAGIPLAALGYLSPVIAGGAMALSSVSVMTNALMLKRWKFTDRSVG